MLLPSSWVVTAFSAVTPPNNKPTTATSKTASIKKTKTDKLNFHQVLQRVGKTVFRPGGSQATEILHAWAAADFHPNSVVLELSAGLGTGGMALADQCKCHVVLSDRDTSRLDQAAQMAKERGLDDLVQVRPLDMRTIDTSLAGDEHYDAVIVEASLTHMPTAVKTKIFADLHAHTKQVLLHEIVVLDGTTPEQASAIGREVGSSLGVGFHPLTLAEWSDLLEQNGYQVTHTQCGPLQFLNPIHILQDEGLGGMGKIAWNLATHADLRQRVLSTKQMMESHRDHLGYIILRATTTTE